MLILSREQNEVIKIGDDIEVCVVEFRGPGKVRLGITAPATMGVHRKEVYERIKREEGAVRPGLKQGQ